MKKQLKKLLKKSQRQKGFTLIEMVVVIAIIVLLLLLIAPNLAKQKESAEKSTDRAFETTLQTQLELYENANDKDKKITFTELRNDGYLTDKQLKKAQAYRINEKGYVEKKR